MVEMTAREKLKNELDNLERTEGYGTLRLPFGALGGTIDKKISDCTSGEVAYFFAKKRELESKLASLPEDVPVT